jgi:hypothetical protein
VGLASFFGVTLIAGASPFSTWGYRSKIAFQGYTKSETLTNFPVLVKLGPGFVAGFEYQQFGSTNGADLRFASSNDTDELTYEIEKWDISGTSYIWVCVTNIAGPTAYIYAYWGKNGAAAPAYTTNGAMWPAATYSGVWHMQATNAPDSSGNRNNGTGQGGISLNSAGMIGDAVRLDGTNGYIAVADANSLDLTGDFTLSLWSKGDNTNSYQFLVNKKATAWTQATGYLWYNSGYIGGTVDFIGKSSGYQRSIAPINMIWHHHAVVMRSGAVATYRDGQIITNTTTYAGGVLSAGTDALWLGRRGADYPGYTLGLMEETRIESVARSTNWVWASWSNQIANTTFNNYGGMEYVAKPQIDNLAPTNITTNSACLNGFLSFTGATPTTVAVYWGNRDGGEVTSGLWPATNTWAVGAWSVSSTPTYVAADLALDYYYYYRYGATNYAGASSATSSVFFLLGGSVQVTASGPTAYEAGMLPGTFTVWRASTTTNEALTVNFAISGTASNGWNYTLSATNSIVIPAGASNVTVTVTPIPDPFDDPTLTVIMTLLPGSYIFGAQTNDTVSIVDAGLTATTNQTKSGGGDWFNSAVWTFNHVPQVGEDVIVTNNLILSNATAWIKSCLISSAVITFTNWDSKLWVGSNVTVTGAGASLGVAGPFTESQPKCRVYVACGSFTLASNASVNVTGGGYAAGNGIGKGGSNGSYGSGGSHGGRGGPSLASGPADASGPTNGSYAAPVDPGSGGGGTGGGAGGGAVLIDASGGTVTIFGQIYANGGGATALTHSGGGSGGSIYITCRNLAGSASGLLQAVGGSWAGGANWGGGGGGGRIAVVYDPGSQAGVNPGVRMQTTYGSAQAACIGANGTLYLSDLSFCPLPIVSPCFSYVNLYFDNPAEWRLDSLMVSNTYAVLCKDAFRIVVTNDVILKAGTFGIGSHCSLECQNLIVTNGGAFKVCSGPTNGIGTNYGALVSVTNRLTVVTNSWIYPQSEPDDGGSPLFRCGRLAISSNAGFYAYGLGFGRYRGISPGVAPGGGGAYGGNGGKGAQAYGTSNAPAFCGSGGAGYTSPYISSAGRGGGLIRIEATGAVQLDGTLQASGEGALVTHGGAGSGGGIFVKCQSFSGGDLGRLTADGGNAVVSGSHGCGGGGGRIAVWQDITDQIMTTYTNTGYKSMIVSNGLASFQGLASVAGGSKGSLADAYTGDTGTVYFYSLALGEKGTILILY